jgi:hypothetical protein
MLLGRGSSGASDTKEILVQLRQDLVLGNISALEGRDRARAALQGMFLSETVNDDVNALLKFISDVRAIYADALRTVETLKSAVPISTPDAAHPTDFQKLAVANALDVLTGYEQRARQIGQQYYKKLRRVRSRLHAISRLVKAAASDEANLMSQIKVAQTRADEDLKRFVAAFEEIQAAWNHWYPTEQRHHKPFAGAHLVK